MIRAVTGSPGEASRRAPVARLLRLGPGALRDLRLAVVCGFAAAAVVVGQAYLTSVVVASVFLGGGDLASNASVLAAIGLLAIIRSGLLFVSDRLAQRAARVTKGRLRAALTGHLSGLGPAWAGRERSGGLTSLLTDGMTAVDTYIVSFEPARMLAVAVPLLVLVAVLVLDPPTALVLVFTGPILVLLLAFIGGRAQAITERRFDEVQWLSSFFLDMLQGMATLKMFGRSREQVDTIRSISRQYGDTTMDVLRTAFQTSLVLEWGGAVAVALVAVEISLRLVAGQIDFDRALAVLIIVPEFFLPLRQLATRYHAGAAILPVADRVFAILDAPVRGSDQAAGASGGPAPSRRIQPDAAIRFSGVGFTYPDRTVPAVSGIELDLRPGRMVALVGATGAGKTTIADLLLRFLEPDVGTILVDDVPVGSIEPSEWRSRLAWVSQSPHLFRGTIADNIRLARPDADAAAVAAAARAAGIDDFISTLSAGLATQVGESGVRLSGGQRQRIALARAFLADARIVILDEATSHLDRESETVIRDAAVRLSADRIVLVVAHRLRLAAVADEVIVLDAGRIVESGPPAELAVRGGWYARLLADASMDLDEGRPS